ncbi:MAG: Anhydro-N-acetylmuramic acid kinase [Alphaproteobacteria bacterium MarineAlpha9_Bin4]|nr:MAG: Anhydro-N-acetylmuramic acid kinase [Alphaproteobacteria bacterium MarineAlpha9_Bin4]
MSGTSFDGVDVAMIKTDGEDYIKFIDSAFIPYTKKEKFSFQSSLINNYLHIINFINKKHLKAIKLLLKKTKIKSNEVDLIGLHGQTIFHKPQEKWSWQYIDAEKFLKTFKTKIVSDFRLNDINRGGEGAPLVPIYHVNIAKKISKKFPVAILNIGGVSNVTIIKSHKSFIGFDVGPGNGPIDKIVFNKFNLNYDKDGKIASRGDIDSNICNSIISEINKLTPKKSYERKVLDDICIRKTENMDTTDALATITKSVADLIYMKISNYNPSKIILVGGGRKNFTLKSFLNDKFNGNIVSAEDVGWDGDSIEAQAFAYLAVRSLLGLNITFPWTTGVPNSISGGVLHSNY